MCIRPSSLAATLDTSTFTGRLFYSLPLVSVPAVPRPPHRTRPLPYGSQRKIRIDARLRQEAAMPPRGRILKDLSTEDRMRRKLRMK